MPPSTVTQNRLENVVTGLTMITNTLEITADSIQTPFLGAIINTTQAVLQNIQNHYVLTTGVRILHKVYTFVETQQKGNKVKSFFRQGEISTLLKDCQAELQQNFDFFQKMSQATALERASTISGHHSWSSNSSTSISMLPSEPKIFHGWESELSDILHLFNTGIPKIAILGAGSMGKTSLARAVLHHPDITARYITMRGAEHPAKVQWTRPFLKVLQPLDQEMARRAFVDTADSGHSLEEIDQILSLADNMPLAISLLAHLADTEGCSNVLSRWDKEKTSVISEGFDKRSNLDMSISLSLSSPRIHSIPHSQELLSLLAMLPDGLTDVDSIQSKLPLENILTCKTTLKSTALAYSDEHKRLKHQPPGDHLVQSLFKYFQEMLAFYVKYIGTQSISSTVPQLKSNHTNIQNVLQWGLKQKQPTLSDSIYCVQTPLMGQIQDLLPQLNDHQLKAYCLIDSIRLWQYYPISNPEALASQIVELFKDFDDPDLKCTFYLNMTDYYQVVKTDLGLATNIQGLDRLAWINVKLGAYSVAQLDGCESQKLFRLSGDLNGEANAARTEAVCWKELGYYKQSLSLSTKAQSLLSLCGLSDSDVNITFMNTQAEVHKCKSEYSEAWTIHTKRLQISTNQSAARHATALLNSAEIAVSIGVQKHEVKRDIDLVRSIFTTLNLKPWIICCDATLADLYIREKDLATAKRLLIKCLELATEHSEIKLFCFERLGNASLWGADESIPVWTTIFLIHPLKCKQFLQAYKALQFFGDTSLHQKDEDTAITLFTVALEGFTCMDVHRSRAECLVRLGDISNQCGDLLKAVELWNTAQPLFERSSQAKEVQHIDKRLASIDNNVLEQQRESIACLVRLDVHSGNLSHIKDEEQVEVIGEPQLTM
ncbi:hypothetical protein DFH08DRAFT_1014142 [Mycena albidolilacea]|uniref:TPR repeat-containing protein n=1 Tax=Mycena albidolilacea TaxID=1033008 RepID=A0AAD7ENX7_9AGAR|nr:hypothetical protein DFH08DRAFT_1014142 [Mycena albidolilacea]